MQPPSDVHFCDTGSVEVPNLGSMKSGGYGPAKVPSILSGVSQAGSSSFAQNLAFELRKNREQSGHASLMSSLLFGVQASSPLVLTFVAAVLIIVALFATYIPALKAMRIDPVLALRWE